MEPTLTLSELEHALGEAGFAGLFGLAPGRANGKDVILTTLVQTPLGPVVAAAVDQGLCLLEFSDLQRLQAQLQTVTRRLKLGLVPGEHPHLGQLREELGAYFAGELQAFTVPLFTPGTPFQEAVWAELLRIPYGQTLAYETVAGRIGKPTAVRAVGHANGMNPVSILIPCHRVLAKDGNLCGYGGGLWRKRLLLTLEQTGHLSTVS